MVIWMGQSVHGRLLPLRAARREKLGLAGLSTFEAFKHMQAEDCVELSGAQLRQLQGILLTMLDDIVAVCEANGINYSLGGGSVLGALRHQGFIPWDDDIDLNMPRSDLERFIPLFLAAHGDRYWVHTPQTTHNFALSMVKIRRKGTVMRGRDDYYSDECGICIDIFPIENTPDNRLARAVHGVVSLGLGYLLSCRKFWRDRREMRAIAARMPQVKKAFYLKIAVGCLISPLSVDWWCRTTDRWHSICRNDQSEYVSGCSGRLHYFGELYQRNEFLVMKKACFEGRSVNIPVGSEDYMTHCYGDWRTPPPESAREKHYVFSYQAEEEA